ARGGPRPARRPHGEPGAGPPPRPPVFRRGRPGSNPPPRGPPGPPAPGARGGGPPRHAARAEAADTLADLGLAPEQLLRRPAGLSGGQLQRAALARALLARPRVLLCDEITTALDEPTAARIHRHLDAYRRRTGAAIVAIGHDLPGQLDRADRVALVDAGRLVDLGPPARLLAQPRTPLLADLLAAESPPGQGT
ncbi:ATP-binding cassette domain-containing protein, partial [Nocardia farcinica]|uniref:ATP-binding cassette domain-containing protein n=1 Tax=Nocardia farcinica TaxID=37329 RepID=UPI00245640F6